MFNNSNNNSRDFLEQQFSTARMNLLIVVSFTVTNIVMLLGGSYTMFLFSATIPYLLTAMGMGMDMELGGSTYTTTAVIIAAVILVAYLVMWLLSKKRPGLLYVALGLFALDTVLLVGFCLLSGTLMSELMNLGFHGWVLYILFMGARSGSKLKSMPADHPVTGADFINANAAEPTSGPEL
jgi:hypothetical protein